MGKRAQVTVKDLRDEYGAYAPYILETRGFIKELPRKPRKYRKYKVLRELPTYEDYQKISNIKFSYEFDEFFLIAYSEINSILSDCIRVEDKAIEWLYTVHRENNSSAIDALENALNKLSLYINSDTGQIVDQLKPFLCNNFLVYQPEIDHLQWMVRRKTNRNDRISEIVKMILLLMQHIRGKNFSSKFLSVFLGDLQDSVVGALANIRFTSFRQR